MNANVGNTDRMVRIVGGLLLLSLILLLEGPMRWVGLIGLAPLVTGLVRWCPAYAVFGANTCETKSV